MTNTESSLLNQTMHTAAFALSEYFRPLAFAARLLRFGAADATVEPAVTDDVDLAKGETSSEKGKPSNRYIQRN